MKRSNKKRLQRKSYKRAYQGMRQYFYTATAIIILIFIAMIAIASYKKANQLISPLPIHAFEGSDFGVILASHTSVETVEVPRNTACKSETCEMIAYIAEKFQDDADEMIAIIRTCENGKFTADRVSALNIQKSGRRSYDVGLTQINADENDTEEIERLKNWRYNIDRAYAKYKGRGNKFTDWTCAHVVNQKNYLQSK